MNAYTIAISLLTLAVMISYLNHRLFKMHSTIGILVGSLLCSCLFLILGQLGFTTFESQIKIALSNIDFHHLVIDGMLSFLLFAGSLNVDVKELKAAKWEIAVLSTVSTIVSTFIIAGVLYGVSSSLGFPLSFIYCALFGALISPTDPIAVLAIFKKLHAPKQLHATVAGESLFNDGVGIVLFITLYQLAFNQLPVTVEGVTLLFLQQAVGGILYGIGLGLLGYWLIKPIDEHHLEIAITLALVTAGYALAQSLNISGPLAMVVAGLFFGNRDTPLFMSEQTRVRLHHFWEFVDEMLNAVLFLLIGLEILVISFDYQHFFAACWAIPLVLIARLLTVSVPMSLFKLKKRYPKHTIAIMTWGGLRGGLAVALALALPNSAEREIILAMTYAVVLFAIIVQGLTITPLVKHCK